MKLMRLLTVGRSWNGGKPGNYKLQQGSPPKFASSVRPSKAGVKVVIGKNAASAQSAPTVSAPVPVVRIPPQEINVSSEPVSQGMDKTQKIPAGTVLKRKPEPMGMSMKTKLAALMQKQIAAVKKRLFPVRSKKKSGAIATQTEWNLEKVTVARNDLSESDLEVVSPKMAEAPSRKMHLPDLNVVKNSGRAWIKKTSNLFKTSSPFAEKANEKQSEAQREPELAERL